MKPFNVRVYALLEHLGKILVLHEPFHGKLIYKFPGGGLEFGEGTKDCVKRELLEELNINVEVNDHFYTQDFFKYDEFNSNEQILLIYYKATIATEELNNLKILDEDIKNLLWIKPEDLNEAEFSLETDKVVIELYKQKNFESH